jgi:hypothetical protein
MHVALRIRHLVLLSIFWTAGICQQFPRLSENMEVDVYRKTGKSIRRNEARKKLNFTIEVKPSLAFSSQGELEGSGRSVNEFLT